MTDYSLWRACQWIVKGPGDLGPYRHLCRRRARYAIGYWTWLCRQHADMADKLDRTLILRSISHVAGRPDGQL